MALTEFSKKVKEYFIRPKRLGLLSERQIDPATERLLLGEAGSIARGDALRLSLRVRIADERILDCAYQNFGSGLPLASASSFCAQALGKSLREADRITALDLDRDLEGLPELQQRKAVLVLDAFDNALRKFRQQPPREKSPSAETPVCTCYQVSAETLERAIRLRHLKTMDELTAATKACAGCNTCRPDVEALLERCLRRDYRVHLTPNDYARAQTQSMALPPSAEELALNPPPPAVAPMVAAPPRETAASLTNAPLRNATRAADGFVYPKESPVAKAATAKHAPAPLHNWRELTHEQRLALLEKTLEDDLRPAIRADGGDIKLNALVENKVRVTLHGHCAGCFSALSTLKLGVERHLREHVWPELDVEEVVEGY